MNIKAHDHRYGAGRINPRRLGAKLKVLTHRFCRDEGFLLRLTTNLLLILLLVSIWKDLSPLAVSRDVIDALEGVFNVGLRIAVFFTD